MPYLNTTTASFGHSVYDVRAAYPGASIPNGVSFGNFEWFRANEGAPYDLMGNVRFVLPWLADSEKGWFCSEAMAAALKLKEPWRFGPNGLAALLRWCPTPGEFLTTIVE